MYLDIHNIMTFLKIVSDYIYEQQQHPLKLKYQSVGHVDTAEYLMLQ